MRYWRRLLRVLWTTRSSNQSNLKETNTEFSLEGLMPMFQYFCHMMQGTNSLEKTLMLGKMKAGGEGNNRGQDGWMASPTQWTWVWANSGRWWRTGKFRMLQSMGLQRIIHDWATEQKQQQSKILISCPTPFLRLVPKHKPRAKHLNIPSIISLQHYEDLADEGDFHVSRSLHNRKLRLGQLGKGSLLIPAWEIA